MDNNTNSELDSKQNDTNSDVNGELDPDQNTDSNMNGDLNERINMSDIPYNTIMIDPLKASLEEIDESWNHWGERNPPIAMPSAVGAIATMLLQKIAGVIVGRVLTNLFNRLFPGPGNQPITMEDILRATEELVNRKLEELVRQQVQAELRGLSENIKTFEEDIQNFELYNSDMLKEMKRIQNELEYASTGILSPTPKAIIDSINTLNQFFVNRMPQFQLPNWKVELLPLFAQAANLHLLFIRDVIDNAQKWHLTASQVNTYKTRLKDYTRTYSNYCISTYHDAFKSRFPNTRFEIMLEFRTFMTLNVLDFVSIWSMLKYDQVVINSSSNLYFLTKNTNKDPIGIFPLSYWQYLNTLFQGRPNKILSGLSAIIHSAFLKGNFATIPQQPRARIEQIQGLTTSYYLVNNHIFMGATSIPPGRPIYPEDFWRQIERSISFRDPLVAVNQDKSYQNHPLDMRMVESANYMDQANKGYNLVTAGGRTYVEYPDRYVGHVIGLPAGVDFSTRSPINLISGPGRIETGIQSLNGLVASFNRTKIDMHTNNGSITHSVPYVENKPTGFMISPLHFDTIGANPIFHNEFVIHERLGNFGDAAVMGADRNAWSHFVYRIRNNGAIGQNYKVFVKVSGISELHLYFNTQGIGSRSFNTSTDNDGINDNGRFNKYIEFNRVYISPTSDNTLEIYAAGSLHIEQILFFKENLTPIY
ncbi:Cry2Aa [Bacillus mycoides FSL H7-687]|nr:Cry2Aa [Bacillus mycoides FSL H7-687]